MPNTKTLKNNNKINSALEEISLLRSAVIGWIGKDEEGEYNPRFIDEIIESSKDGKISQFTTKQSFLDLLKK